MTTPVYDDCKRVLENAGFKRGMYDKLWHGPLGLVILLDDDGHWRDGNGEESGHGPKTLRLVAP